MTPKYETREISWLVNLTGDPMFSELATKIEINEDVSAGEFVVVSQDRRDGKGSRLTIIPQEWPAIKEAIDKAIKQCREEKR